MTTRTERRMEVLAEKLQHRTRADGAPAPGFEQNVAAIRAEMEQMSVTVAATERRRKRVKAKRAAAADQGNENGG